jgi:predicted MPP superfamily phosphohydrolase
MVAGSGPNGIPDVAVITESRQPSQYTLAWGTPGTTFIIKEEGNTTTHIFMLCSLEPDTDYWYRVNDGPVYHFSTPAASGALHFAIGSDAHFGAGDNRPYLTAQMLAQIADPANDFGYFFSLGDLVEYGFRVEQWQEALATLSPVTTSIPAGFVAGNHDALFTGVDRFREYCYPAGVETKTESPLWYRFDVGNIHFLVLDLEWSVETFSKEQEDWLESELNSIPADDWTIVLSHGYFFASGSVQDGWPWYDNPEAIRRITPIFERYDVDLVFSGHVHQMELLEKAGVTYVIVGSFGGIPDPERTYISPVSLWYVSGQYGFVDVTIETGRALITFRDPSGGVLKTAVVDK